ncbi:MAG: hypothetical protein JNL64_07905 [Blastocatellia bacterium]|nr:hypothetical protein [Blastocatellia bacterium]
MKRNQLNRGVVSRIMYVENKDGDIDGAVARVGYVQFSKSGLTVYYRGRKLKRARGVRGNHVDLETGDEYWISGVKKSGSNAHWAESVKYIVDEEAVSEYQKARKD